MNEATLRILFVGVKWPPETFLMRLVRGLAKRGHWITLAVAGRPDATWQPIANVELLHMPSWAGSQLGRVARTGSEAVVAVARSPRATAQVIRQARQSSTDMSPLEKLFRWLPFAGRSWDVIYFPWNATAISYMHLMDYAPTVISCRGTQINVAPHNPERATLREGLPLTFAKAAAVHCVSEAIGREAVQYGLDLAKAVVIRPAVDPDAFCPGPRPASDTFRLITTGSVIWRKGYEFALAAVDRLRQQGVPVTLEIIGSGDEEQRLLYTLNDLNLLDSVTWRGWLPPAEVVQRLQSADAFLLTSVSEGISNALLEAMACGLPVVATAIDGMDEVVTDGVEGLVVPPRNIPATAAALQRLWADCDERYRLGQAGRARVLRDFHLRDQVDAFERLFRSVV